MDESYLDLLMAQQEEAPQPEVEGGGGVWVVADVIDGAIAPVTLEALGAARTLADAVGAYVHGLVLGEGVGELARTMYQAGADGVWVADHAALARFAVEPYRSVLAPLVEAEQPEVILFGATAQGQALAPRVAQGAGGGLIEHATSVRLDEATRAVEAAVPIYGGEYFELRACPEARPQVLTIEPGAFAKPFVDPQRRGEATVLEVEPAAPKVELAGPADGFEPPPVPLGEAAAIVAAGRAAGDFELVKRLAAALGAQVAGDRGARDAGWIEAGQVVDVRGVEVAPRVYLAVGVRGDAFHNAAIEGAGFVAAIHPDSHAPIFEVADACVEGDPAEVATALLEALE